MVSAYRFLCGDADCGGGGPPWLRLKSPYENAIQNTAENNPMSVAERMAPMSSSEGSPPMDRTWSIVATGQVKHSRPRKSVVQAQMPVMVRPRQDKKAAVAMNTSAAASTDTALEANHAPTATTSPPKTAFKDVVHDDGMLMVCTVADARPGALSSMRVNYTVRFTKKAAACARREMWSFWNMLAR